MSWLEVRSCLFPILHAAGLASVLCFAALRYLRSEPRPRGSDDQPNEPLAWLSLTDGDPQREKSLAEMALMPGDARGRHARRCI